MGHRWEFRDRGIAWGGDTRIMGILNVTPDSFSDGGLYPTVEAAAARGEALVEQGAAILDIGGESTRPGAAEVPAAEECNRVVPVIRALRARTDATLSLDTRKAAVAREGLAAGAHIINDVSALTHDPEMAAVVAESGAGVVLMHMQGSPETMQTAPHYHDVVREVCDFLASRIDACEQAGIPRSRIAIDPGIGFGKTVEHNLALLRGLPRLAALGCPVVVGVSRKRFLGALTGRAPADRLAAGLGAQAYAALHGAHVLRVHDVLETCDAVRIVDMLAAPGP
jgi:dihydropteroate synthase